MHSNYTATKSFSAGQDWYRRSLTVNLDWIFPRNLVVSAVEKTSESERKHQTNDEDVSEFHRISGQPNSIGGDLSKIEAPFPREL